PPLRQVRTAPAATFGPLLLRLHFYAGVLVAPFLLLAALTGLAYAFSPQLDRLVYADELVVGDPGGPVQPLAAQIAAARAAHPAGAVTAVRPGDGAATTQVDFSSPELDFEHQHTVYVNQYSGTVTGQLTTWWTSTPMQTWLDDMHTSLHLGPVGNLYSELAASWLAVIALGGLILWWRRQRGRRMLTPDLKAKKGVRRTRGFHAATGVWLTLGLLFLALTGLTWSQYAGANFGAAVDALNGSRPAVSTALTGTPAATGGGHHGMGTGPATGTVDPAAADAVLKVARGNGIDGPVSITVPADAATAWSVTETGARWPIQRDAVAIDSTTGTITDRSDFADWPFMAKLTQWGTYAHMGQLFGLVNQLLLAALAVGLICVIVWGYRMWWQRRPTRADRRAPVGTPPARGAWQQLPPWAIAVGVPLVFGLAWAVPLFGIPLAAFLLADFAIGAIRARRTTPPVPVSPAPAGS
ncbi:PepSY-associated TM helix domain-containing protein, partial [Paractinoplanes toevensis]|uniref:PepSY-associated TM helix domain-containing protein n=1 Tax=Paractinoplanes toevensis TaxID=571911 RepID=UPI0027DB9790